MAKLICNQISEYDREVMWDKQKLNLSGLCQKGSDFFSLILIVIVEKFQLVKNVIIGYA